MNRIEELEAEVARLKEQLQPYLDAEEAERKKQEFEARLDHLVDLCVPSYDAASLRYTKEEPPLRYPDLQSWWNGATIENYEEFDNGDYRVNVRSYVGGGEYEHDEIIIFKDWIEAENPKPLIEEWIKAETKRIAIQRAEYARKELERKMASLSKELENLK